MNENEFKRSGLLITDRGKTIPQLVNFAVNAGMQHIEIKSEVPPDLDAYMREHNLLLVVVHTLIDADVEPIIAAYQADTSRRMVIVRTQSSNSRLAMNWAKFEQIGIPVIFKGITYIDQALALLSSQKRE